MPELQQLKATWKAELAPAVADLPQNRYGSNQSAC